MADFLKATTSDSGSGNGNGNSDDGGARDRRANCNSSCVKRNYSSRRRCGRFCFSYCSSYRSQIEALLLSTIAVLISLPYECYALDISLEATTVYMVNAVNLTTGNAVLMQSQLPDTATHSNYTNTTNMKITPDVPMLKESKNIVNGDIKRENITYKLPTTSSAQTLDENNEVFTVWISPNHVNSKADSFEASLTEDLEETIRNAVKTEIENEQNIGPYSLSALKNIPEPEVRQKLTEEILSRKYVDQSTIGDTATTVELHQNEGEKDEKSMAEIEPDGVQNKIQDIELNENTAIESNDGNCVFDKVHPNDDIENGNNITKGKDTAQIELHGTDKNICNASNSHSELNSECYDSPAKCKIQTVPDIQESNTTTPSVEDDDSLSIVFEEQFTATEPPVIYIDERIKNMINLEDNLKEYEATTISDQFFHSVIKKQGVVLSEATTETNESKTFLLVQEKAENEFENNVELPVELMLTDTVTDTVTEYSFGQQQISTVESEFELDVTVDISTESKAEIVTELITTITELNPIKKDNDFKESSVNETTISSKGSRSLSPSHHNSGHFEETLIKSYTPSDVEQVFNKYVAAESTQEVEKVVHTNSSNISRSIVIILVCCSTASLFVVILVTMFLISFQKQHGTLDIEMQERRCGKDDEDIDTCQKLLEIELPPPVLTIPIDET